MASVFDEMTQRFDKWLKYLGNGSDIWGTA